MSPDRAGRRRSRLERRRSTLHAVQRVDQAGRADRGSEGRQDRVVRGSGARRGRRPCPRACPAPCHPGQPGRARRRRRSRPTTSVQLEDRRAGRPWPCRCCGAAVAGVVAGEFAAESLSSLPHAAATSDNEASTMAPRTRRDDFMIDSFRGLFWCACWGVWERQAQLSFTSTKIDIHPLAPSGSGSRALLGLRLTVAVGRSHRDAMTSGGGVPLASSTGARCSR